MRNSILKAMEWAGNKHLLPNLLPRNPSRLGSNGQVTEGNGVTGGVRSYGCPEGLPLHITQREREKCYPVTWAGLGPYSLGRVVTILVTKW